MVQKRNYKYDNMRFLLMFLVIFGHFLAMQDEYFLYRFIYTFHMPAFVFLSGYFAKPNRKKILESFLYPYLLFQVLYELFDVFVIRTGNSFELQFTTPYWILWYLLLLIVYYLMIPLIDEDRLAARILLAAAALAASVLIEYDSSIGPYLAFSRLFSYLPYFVLGFYAGHPGKGQRRLPDFLQKWWCKVGILVLACICEVIVRKNERITPVVLYGEQPYHVADYDPGIKLLILGTAICWILLLVLLVPGKRLPVITVLGQHTMPVYLLHGFVIMLAEKYFVFPFGEAGNLLLTAVFSLALMALLGNPWAASAFDRIFTGRWISIAVDQLAAFMEKKKKGSSETVK